MKNPEDIDNLIDDWRELCDKLKYYKHQEMLVRKEICQAFGIERMNEGTNHRQTDDYMIEVNRKFSYSVEEETLDEIWDDLDDIEKECIKTKRSLLKSKYNDLLDSSMLDDAIVVKDAAPTLKVTRIQ